VVGHDSAVGIPDRGALHNDSIYLVVGFINTRRYRRPRRFQSSHPSSLSRRSRSISCHLSHQQRTQQLRRNQIKSNQIKSNHKTCVLLTLLQRGLGLDAYIYTRPFSLFVRRIGVHLLLPLIVINPNNEMAQTRSLRQYTTVSSPPSSPRLSEKKHHSRRKSGKDYHVSTERKSSRPAPLSRKTTPQFITKTPSSGRSEHRRDDDREERGRDRDSGESFPQFW
jgi:hypothetical protein